MTEEIGEHRALTVLRAMRPIPDQAAQDALTASLADPVKPTIVSFVNAHALNLAWGDAKIAKAFQASDILLRDGIGVSLLMKLLGMDRGVNMNGTDYIPALARAFAGRRIALCGTAEPFLSDAAARLRAEGLDIVITMDGFRDIDTYAPAIMKSTPDLVILGMGMPKQEAVAIALRTAATKPVLIVNGGAIIDFWAGKVVRAPSFVRTLRLEWLFRLVQEPQRLWRRYLLGGLIFVGRALRLKRHAGLAS